MPAGEIGSNTSKLELKYLARSSHSVKAEETHFVVISVLGWQWDEKVMSSD